MADVKLDPSEYEAFYGTQAAPGERVAYNPLTSSYTALGNARTLLDFFKQGGGGTGGGGYGGGYGGGGQAGDGSGDYSVSGYFGGKDTEAYKKYKKGKEAGKWKDLNDYMAQGGTQSGAGGASGNFADNLLKTIKGDIEEQVGFLDKYTKKNPFAFDEELARKSSTAEYEPYYNELLDDYVSQVDLRRATIEDDKKLQQEFKKYETEKSSRDFNKAISNAEQGFAGKGLFFSGNRARDVGEKSVEKVAGDEMRTAQYKADEAGLDRRSTSLDLESSAKTRDIGREQETAIEGGILQRRGEAITQYNVPLTQTYQRRFPVSGSQNALAGYLVPDYMRY